MNDTNNTIHRMKIGQYNIISTIGTGSFGKVKLAVHAITGQKVALKIINRKKIASMDMGGRVKREIQYLKLLRHPHIIKLYEVITTPTDIIMVIEYAGRELFNYIVEKGRMSEDDARRFFQQIICAVEYCHRHKIVHRDLKPENLLLDANNNVKIADFGLSNIMTDGDFLKTSCGSPNYAAPEVISGKLYAGPEVDVWSCGVILYVMLCGRLPFDDEYIPTLFKKINGGIFTMPSYLSSDTKALLTSMLVVDPLKRITIQGIRQNEWFNKNLPAYLRPLPDTEENGNLKIDDDIVLELSKKMGYSTQVIQKALSESDNNQFKVAYQLVVDHKRLLQDSENNHIQSFFATSPPPWNTTLEDRYQKSKEDDIESSISVLSSSLPKSDTHHQASIGVRNNAGNALPIVPVNGTPPPGAMAPSSIHIIANHSSTTNRLSQSRQTPLNATTPQVKKSHKSSRSRWHFGIRSKCPAWEVMLEIYKSLRNVGMEWRTLDPYHLRCRYRYKNLGLEVKFDLQLYKLESHSYLVDFKNVGSQRFARKEEQEEEEEHLFKLIEGSIDKKMEVLDHSEEEDNDDDPSQYLARWKIDDNNNREHIQSVYAFLDVCSKLITDIV
ncbi:kinase-like domain-containing protein [Cokeromyces recurvatus]|uniref:kinase-like domain-containing protein n=1 Tax=Cokeromyces recurvatus TaxID=90255 RepID=UPI00221F90EB|nr:kinase-like domain-containing protein [Cokeromyces recurvatus]KAI7907674.1 kinase-like domain-containing protein [Cokeromyces recurvatus]